MSTQNYRELFNAYRNGFSNYPAWIDHHKAMHAKHPLECAEFGAEWLRRWEAVGRLLESRCIVQEFSERFGWWDAEAWQNAGRAILTFAHRRSRVALLDGTIVKEWGVTQANALK